MNHALTTRTGVRSRARRFFSITGITLALTAAGAAQAAGDVVISQYYGGAGNPGAQYDNDYVELFNRSQSPVVLTGWSVQYASATGTGNFVAVPIGGVLQPGQYFLVQFSGAPGAMPLPSPDAVASTQMSPTDGKVILASVPTALRCNGGSTPCSGTQMASILDLVGIGTADFFEEAAAPAGSNTTALLRLEAGCMDNDSNAGDFVAGTPTPRNSASPFAPCALPESLPIVASCPVSLQTDVGVGASASLQAFDPDGFVMSAVLTGGVPGISLVNLAPCGTFTAQLDVAPSVPAGSYALTVTFSNIDIEPQTASCDVAVNVTQPAATMRIHDIQGVGHLSPLTGQPVSDVPGIVTAVAGNGFFLEDSEHDADVATSEGIFVFTRTAPTVRVGDAVRVSGSVSEFRPGGSTGAGNLTTTAIVTPTVSIVSRGNVLPPAMLLGSGGRHIPAAVIDDDASGDVETSGSFDATTDGIDFYESLEGMRVRLNSPVAVGPTNGRDEVQVLADAGIHAGVRTARGGILAQPGDSNPERIFVDDVLAPAPDVNVGDTFPEIVGVVGYSFGNFKVHATAPLARIDNALAPETASLAGTSGGLTVGSYDVANLAATDPSEKFSALATQIVGALRSPDILALTQVQDNSGAMDDGVVDSSQTFNSLIAAIRAAGGPGYRFRVINPANNADGGPAGGNARIGFLFNPQRVKFVDRAGGNATTALRVSRYHGEPKLSASPGRIDPGNAAFANSGKPLAAEFLFNGRKIFVIANDFVPALGDDPLFGVRQPRQRASEAQRLLQAAVVRDFAARILAMNRKASVMVLGGLNDTEYSASASLLQTDGLLHNLAALLPAEERYNHVHDGNAQALDHIFASSALIDYGRPEIDVVHANAEFAAAVSDQDPALGRFELGKPGDADRDGDVDAIDLLIIARQRGRTPNPYDPRDVDENGVVDQYDVCWAITLCTRRHCGIR